MEEAVEEVLRCTIIASASVVYGESMKTRKRKRKYWVRDYFRERDQDGAYKLTLEELRLNDLFSFRRYLRMNTHVYEVHVSFFCHFPIQGYPMWTNAQMVLKDFDRICTKVIFRSTYFNSGFFWSLLSGFQRFPLKLASSFFFNFPT